MALRYFGIDKGKEVVTLLGEVKRLYEEERAKLTILAEASIPALMKLKELPSAGSYPIGEGHLKGHAEYWFKNQRGYYSGDNPISTVTALDKRLEEVKQVVDKYIADCTAVHEENKPVCEHNKAIADKVTNIMIAVGIPDKYYSTSYKSSRSRKMTTETQIAGYKQDLDRNVKWQQPSIPNRDSLINSAINIYNKLKEEVMKKEYEKERKKKEQEDIHKVALLRAKYTPDDASSDAYTLRHAILSKNKYLHLAYWLECNRGNWSDGYSHAKTGLDGFSIETEEDRDIYKDIHQYIEDWDGDGRVFRDYKYNYSVLYSMVEDQSLLRDLEQLTSWYAFT